MGNAYCCLIVGIALFFEVGLVLLIPLVFTVAKRANVSILKLGLPMVTALSVTHGFLPHTQGQWLSLKNLKQILVKSYFMV